MPFCFNQAGLTVQLKAPVDLLADKSKRAPRRQPESGEQLIEKALETQATRLGIELGDFNEERRECSPSAPMAQI